MNILSQRAQGFVQCCVVDAATGKVVKEYPRQKNLILNQGMEKVYDLGWADLMLWCSAGTGTTPTSVDSGVLTADWVGTAITISGGALLTNTGTDAGKIIKWDSGEEARILTVSSATDAIATTSAPGSPTGQFTIYNTNQSTLATLVKSTSTYLTGAPYCQTVLTANVYALRRTYDFTAEAGSVSYTEISVGWVSTLVTPTAIFSRILLAAPVAVTAGQQLRVTYQLELTLLPAAPTARSAIPISGWPVAPAANTDGTEALQLIGLSSVGSDGSSSSFDLGSTVNEPSTTGTIFLSTVATAPQTIAAIVSAGGPISRAGTSPAQVGVTRAAYIPASFYVDKTGTFAVGAANSTAWRSMGMGSASGGLFQAYDRTTVVFVFGAAQTKLNTHTLTLTWRFTWSRVLS